MRLLTILFLYFCISFGTVNASVTIPLYVSELLPEGHSGSDRFEDIATGGIPLPENAGIKSINQLGLEGPSAGQFRAIGWWPNGNIKWVLVDFPVTLSANKISTNYSIIDGSGNFGGPDLAIDNGSTISISTGAARFSITKANFNILDSVAVGSTPLITSGHFGGLQMVGVGANGSTNKNYSSVNDSSSTAMIEENGPVRAVVKATGALKDGNGNRHMDYTMRLHFYKGKSQVKAIVSLRHASKTNAYKSRNFKSVEAYLPVNLSESKTVRFDLTTDSGRSSTPTALGVNQTSYLMQGFYNSPTMVPNLRFDKGCYYWTPPIAGTCNASYQFTASKNGVKAVVGSSIINDFGDDTEFSTGLASIEDSSGKGVVLAYQSLFGYWPGGFELKDNGDVSIELYSKYNTEIMKMQHGSYNTREILWNFYTGKNAEYTKQIHTIEYPLHVRTDIDWYAKTEALYGQSHFVTEAEQAQFMTEMNKGNATIELQLPKSVPNPDNLYVQRGWTWAAPSGWNQVNYVAVDMFDYLRTGRGGWFLRAKANTRMRMDSAIGRSDDFTSESVTLDSEGQTLRMGFGISSPTADGEHAYFFGTSMYYFITGDEGTKDAWLDYGDRLVRNHITLPYYQLPDTPWLRAWSHTLRNMATVYEFSCDTGACDSRLQLILETAIEFQIDSRGSTTWGLTGRGRDMDRGFIYWDTDVLYSGEKKRVIHSFYHNQLHFEALYHLYRIMQSSNWNYVRINDFEDYITGLSLFYMNELIVPAAGNMLGDNGIHNFLYAQDYNYKLDEMTSQNNLMSVYTFSRPSLWAYEQTGDASHLLKGYEFVWQQPAYSIEQVRNASTFQDQAAMWAYFNSNKLPAWQNLNLNSVYYDKPKNQYTLSWTVPTDAIKIRIKHSSKQLVEWLGFDQDSRTFLYSPSTHTPFFAGNYAVVDLPPYQEGSNQSITLDNVPENSFFYAKYLRDAYTPLILKMNM